jgi:hypothetical protein
MVTLKYGIRVPRNVKQDLLMDQENGNTHWHDAIKKEMDALLERGVFNKVSDKKAMLNSRSPNRARAHTHRHVRAL